MNEPKPVIPTYLRNVRPTEHGGFHMHPGAPPYTSSFSSDFGTMFNGVEIPEGTSIEERRVLLYMCQEWMRFLEKLGWYEHTADWDQHAEVHLYDSRHTHNDGVFLELHPPVVDHDYVGGSNDGVGPLYVVLESVCAYEDDLDTRTLLRDYGKNVHEEGEDLMGDLHIPIELISKVNLGWCT